MSKNNAYSYPSTVCCYGRDGLGNRMLSLEAACRLAQEFKKDIYIDWNDPIYEIDNNLWDELFTINGIHRRRDLKIQMYSKPYPKDISLFSHASLINCIHEIKDEQKGILKYLPYKKLGRWKRAYRYNSGLYAFRNGENLGTLAQHHDVVLWYCSIPENEPEHFRHLRIRDTMQQEFQSLSQQGFNTTPDIGLHVRHTDKQSGSLTKLYKLINKALEAYSRRPTIHIATDNGPILTRLKTEYNSRANVQYQIIERANDPLHLRIKSKENKHYEVKQALFDMMFLSQSKHFIFQKSSSFSRVSLALSSYFSSCESWD